MLQRRPLHRAVPLLLVCLVALSALLVAGAVSPAGARAGVIRGEASPADDTIPGQQPGDVIITPSDESVNDGVTGPGILINARDLPPSCASDNSQPTTTSGYLCSNVDYQDMMDITNETNDGSDVDITFTQLPYGGANPGDQVLYYDQGDEYRFFGINRSDFHGYEWEPYIENNESTANQGGEYFACTVGASCTIQLTDGPDGTDWMELFYQNNQVMYIPTPPNPDGPVPALVANPVQGDELQYDFDASGSTDATGTITQYQWDFGDGDSETTSGPSESHTYAEAGTYTVTLTEVDSNNQSTSKSITVVTQPAWKVAAASVDEPASGTVTAEVPVTLSKASTSTQSVSYSTADGTATSAHGDYTPATGTITFSPGQTSADIPVTVNASGLQKDAAFNLVLSSPSDGTVIDTGSATVTIHAESAVAGSVLDGEGHPMAGVSVLVTGADGTHLTSTDADGKYSIDVAVGDHTVTALPSDGRYVPQAGADCTVSGSACSVDVVANAASTANFVTALSVTSVAFQQLPPGGGAYASVPGSGTYDGNTVHVVATITNSGSQPLTATPTFGRAAYPNAPTTTALVGQGTSTVTVPAGGQSTVSFDWDTQGDAWTTTGLPDPDHLIRAGLDLGGAYDEQSITVRPKPVVLVHGLNSDAATWSSYQGFLTTVNPLWQAFAVGDGQAPGVMNTSPFASGHPNSIYVNAQQEAKYIQGVREETGAWHVDIVAHSMGGLISRQYIDALMPADPPDGRPVVDHLVMLGTPNEGSPCVYLLQVALGADYSEADAQLDPSFEAAFNQTVTNRHGVAFSILAGDALDATCEMAGPGDSVVPVTSALWNLTDTTIVKGVFHTAMTSDPSIFTTWVLPHLAVGPATSTAAPARVSRHPANTATTDPGHRARSSAAPTATRAAKRVCRNHAGTPTPTFSAAGSVTATPAGAVRRLTVTPARSVAVTLMAPDVTVRLRAPGGRTYTTNTTAGSLFQTITVPRPRAGTWQLTLTSAKGRRLLVPYTLIEVGAATRLSASFTARGQVVSAIRARFTDAGRPVRAARITAEITLANGRRRPVRLSAVAGHPGVYAARVSATLASAAAPLRAVISAGRGAVRASAAASITATCS